jgi:opacity protein-like surface antigen
MMKRIALFAALATTLVASAAMAEPAKGKWGLGYFSEKAPVGARYWLSPKLGLDLGVGFTQNEDEGETVNGYAFDIGLPIVLGNYENAFFFVRPGFLYSSDEDAITGTPVTVATNTQYAIGADFGVEWFINDRFSLQVAHGIGYVNNDPENGDSSSSIATRGLGISNVGFHFYFN